MHTGPPSAIELYGIINYNSLHQINFLYPLSIYVCIISLKLCSELICLLHPLSHFDSVSFGYCSTLTKLNKSVYSYIFVHFKIKWHRIIRKYISLQYTLHPELKV